MGRSRKFEDPKLVGFKLEREEVEQLDRIIEEQGISRSKFLRKFSRSVIQKKDSITVENQNFNINMNIQQQKQQQIQRQNQIIQWMVNVMEKDLEKIKETLKEGLSLEDSSHSELAIYKMKNVQEDKMEKTIELVNDLQNRIRGIDIE